MGFARSAEGGTEDPDRCQALEDLAAPEAAPHRQDAVWRSSDGLGFTVELQCLGNFAPSKTEVLVLFHGKGSDSQRRHPLAEDVPTLPVALQDGSNVKVALTDKYLHLGNLVHHRGGDLQDIARHKMLAQSILDLLKRRFLGNKFLKTPIKYQLFLSMVVRKFLHGSGGWALRFKKEQHAYTAAYMSFVRQACYYLSGHSSAGLTNRCAAPLPCSNRLMHLPSRGHGY